MKTSKKTGFLILLLTITAVIFLTAVNSFALETQSVTLDKATVGVYYEQYIDIDLVLEKVTIPEELAGQYDPNKASIHEIKYDEKELPPGLKIDYTKRSAKFSGIPEKDGTYTFKVTVIGAYQMSFGGFTTTIPLTDMPVDVYVTITVQPNHSLPTEPTFTTKPTSDYSVPVGSSITVPVKASCTDGCNFELYIKESGSWKKVDSKTGVSSWDMKPLDSASVTDKIGAHQFKVVAVNAKDNSLKSECVFTIEVLQKAPTIAAITGNTNLKEGDKLALVCTADGADLSYQWQIKINGGAWQNIGKNESTLSIDTLLSYNDASVQCIVSNSAGSKTSSPVTLRVTAAHTCSYTKSTITRKATCTADGEEKLECTCGNFITKTIKSEGHKFSGEWTIEAQPGCVTPGLKSHRCTACNERKDETPIEPKGHSYGEWKVIKEATTTAEGLEQRTCKNCSNVEERTIAKVVAGHEHSFSGWEIITNPTCTDAGMRVKKCSCGAVEKEAISATGHSFSTEYTVITDATCTEAGTKSRKCTKCNAETDKTTIPAKGHSYGTWVVFKESTTTSEGEERRTCSSCGSYESKTIAKIVAGHTHSFGEWTVVTPATCDEAGLEMRSCSCNSAETRQISPKGHSFDAWKVIVAPTVESEGIEVRTCLAEGCKGSESRILDKLPEGAVTEVPSTTPTPEETTAPETTSPEATTPNVTPDTAPNTDEQTSGGNDDDQDDETIKYLLIAGCGLLGGVLIVLIIIAANSRKKSRWE